MLLLWMNIRYGTISVFVMCISKNHMLGLGLKKHGIDAFLEKDTLYAM